MKTKLSLMIAAMGFLISVQAIFSDVQRDKEGFFTTGSAIRVKRIVFVDVNVYAIVHMMKDVPARSRQAVIDADTDKKIVMRFLRTVEAQKVTSAVRDAFHLNNYTNDGIIAQFLSVLKGDVQEGEYIVIYYNSAAKVTTIYYHGASASVSGPEFMKAIWSCWFGRIDQPSLPESLISQIPN